MRGFQVSECVCLFPNGTPIVFERYGLCYKNKGTDKPICENSIHLKIQKVENVCNCHIEYLHALSISCLSLCNRLSMYWDLAEPHYLEESNKKLLEQAQNSKE